MKRKLTLREQWKDAWRIHRLAMHCDTEGQYCTGDFSPKFKAALKMTEQLNYFQAFMPRRYEHLAKAMKIAKLRGITARYVYHSWQISRQGILIQYKKHLENNGLGYVTDHKATCRSYCCQSYNNGRRMLLLLLHPL